MATTTGDVLTLLTVDPITVPDPGLADGTPRVFHENYTTAAEAAADIIEMGRMPKGARFLYGILNTDTTLATSTIAIGIAGATEKYRADAVLTATDTAEFLQLVDATNTHLTAEEIIIVTVATATMPTGAELKLQMFYTHD